MARSREIRAAVLGAFPFPYPQGSQIYVADHSRALRQVGIEPTLITYGRGRGAVPGDLEVVSSPRWSSPSQMRSGPGLGKFPADAALLATFLAHHRSRPFDVALAHNAEAAAVALVARSLIGVPVIYVVHTLMRFELSSYASPRWGAGLDAIGERLDRWIAGRADGILALCRDAVEILEPDRRCPIALIPPGLDPAPAPQESAVREACAQHGLEPRTFCLYGGNLDGYQDLELLAQAARRLDRMQSNRSPEIAVATHDLARVPAELLGSTRLRCLEVDDFQQLRCLIEAAQSTVLCRRRRGGFPIKLLNYMEAGKPIVAFESVASGFVHLRNAWLLPPDAEGDALADALATLAAEPALAARLGGAARALLDSSHRWSGLAEQTRDFIEGILESRGSDLQGTQPIQRR